MNKLKNLIAKIILPFTNLPRRNVFRRSFSKRVLVSYITRPLYFNSINHSNNFELNTIINYFDRSGYMVDVVNHFQVMRNMNQYDVIFGFGQSVEHYINFYFKRAFLIYYSTGMNFCYANTSTIKRLKETYIRTGEYFFDSIRYTSAPTFFQVMLSDVLISLGNISSLNTFKTQRNDEMFFLQAPFHQTQDPYYIIENRNEASKMQFLWFGSGGAVHKGLDLLLEYFVCHPDLILHICGDISSELNFLDYYHDELYKAPNIIYYSFVSIKSSRFTDILLSASFCIFPSCSEGGGVSVLTAVGNGGLVPIVSMESTIQTGNEILIKQLNSEGVSAAIEVARLMTFEEIVQRQKKNLEYVRNNHHSKFFMTNLSTILDRYIVNQMKN